MAKVLITSGPTRQFLDPVRYLTNASSGQMGAALARAAIEADLEVVIVSGPVHVSYPEQATVHHVLTTDEMFQTAHDLFPDCDGVIGAAAPCDYKVEQVSETKLAKSGDGLTLQLVETPDVIASLGRSRKTGQWAVGFALETHDAHFKAITKMQKKSCDLMVVNGPEAINSAENTVQILDPSGQIVREIRGQKSEVARQILLEICERLVNRQI